MDKRLPPRLSTDWIKPRYRPKSTQIKMMARAAKSMGFRLHSSFEKGRSYAADEIAPGQCEHVDFFAAGHDDVSVAEGVHQLSGLTVKGQV